ncbi:MAG: zf-HC2 domain-containing protein [Terracidiphilus sp.]|nr:zf-HC2 domain-containing protein [Terracidiphilus sp.]MDR3777219.1 zf-HC2 domain-containing protein [Terracidiphilus sp.]
MSEEIKNTALGTHFDEEQLMLYIDGELPSSEANQVKTHLFACLECRQEFSELQEANQAFTTFQEQCSEALPEPPLNWADFSQRLQETLAQPVAERQTWWRRFSDYVRQTASGAILPWTLSGAAAAMALVFLLLHSPAKDPLTVDDVLSRAQQERASLDASVAPVVYQKISITDSAVPQTPITVQIWNDQKNGRFREEAVNGADTDRTGEARKSAGKARQAEPPSLLRDVNAVFAANHLPLTAPVSAEVFKAWVQSPGHKDESISKEKFAGGDAYRLSAKVADSGIPVASTPFIRAMDLLVRANDWHAVAERLTVASPAGTHTYEIAELEYRVIPLSELPGNVFGALEGSAAPISDSGMVATPGAVQLSFADMAVDVLDRLDSVDALVQDQIVVTRAGNEGLQIGGIVRSESRKAEILGALGSLASNPAVKLNLLSAGDARAVGTTPLTHPIQLQSVEVLLNEAGSIPEVRTYLAVHRHVPERDLDQAADHFVSDAVEHSTEAQLHAQALKHIVEILPLSNTGPVGPETREKWRALVSRHAQASRREIRQLEQQLSPVFAHAASGATLASGSAGEEDLQPEASRLLNMTTDSDRILWQAFSSNASAADRRGLTEAEFWLMLKEEDSLAAHIVEKAHP